MQTDKVYKSIGQRINTVLAERGILQKDLAEGVNVSKNTVSYWLSGGRHPSLAQITEVAQFLSVSVDYLLGLSKNSSLDENVQTACTVTGLQDYAVMLLQAYRGVRMLEDETVALPADEISDGEVYLLDILSSIIAGKAFPLLLLSLARLQKHSHSLRSHIDMFSLLGPEEGDAVSALAQRIYDSVRLDRLEVSDQFTRLLDEIVGLDKLIRDYDSMRAEVRKSRSEKHENESEPEG